MKTMIILWVLVFIIGVSLFIFLMFDVVEQVQKVGLKSIVNEVWEGKENK